MEPEDTLDLDRPALGSTEGSRRDDPIEMESTIAGDESLDGDATVLTAADGRPRQRYLEAGTRLGDFTIDRPLGAGGMGQVLEAVGPDGNRVALKFLERAGARMLVRFKQEFRALAHVTHDNLVALGELVVMPDEAAFFTMEIVGGVPFDVYVRGRTPANHVPNPARLRRALRQLVVGVRHLHRSGCVHRDLKPSNVLVTPEGRVVILDFGLVQDRSSEADVEDQLTGTPAYMSPEQAGMERAGPPADWYAVGVMLYECLTGRWPFTGNLSQLLIAKREQAAPRIDLPDAPSDLVDLCEQLLARDPRERASAREILELLGDEDDGDSADSSMVAGRTPFVGREQELAELIEAFHEVQSSRAAVTVHVRGPSGFGKSTLVRECLDELREREAAVVLRGRCLERESVPYKGIDAIVDALSMLLRGMPQFDRDELRPDYFGALVRLFPVLGEIWPIEGSDRTLGLDPNELRQRAFTGLREVLDKLASRRALAVFVDDFHWGDVDSARLLTELVRPPDPPPLLLLVAFRDEVEQNETLQALLDPTALEDRAIREIKIGPLGAREARDLAVRLLTGDGKTATRAIEAAADAAARGAGGSPFFVGQLVRGQGLGAEAGGTSPAELDKIVARRVLGLESGLRALLSVIAVAGGPVRRAVVIAACGAAVAEPALAPLLEGELIRARGGEDGIVETTHDRIREVTVGELEADELVDVHRRLAEAFEQLGGEPESLAEHWERAGDRARASIYFERGAQQASNALAFQRAVELYRKTLALVGPPKDANDRARIDALELGLANQLINAGSGREAAHLLLGLADRSRDVAEARELRRRGADQLIKTGYVDEGLAQVDRLLGAVGLALPKGQAAAITALFWEQARAMLRGRSFQRRNAGDIDPAVLDRIDSCFAVVNGLSTQEILLSAIFHFRNLRASLDCGEPHRVARALAYQCVIDVAGRKWDHVESQLATARALVAELDDPQLTGFIDLCEASCHWFERRFTTSAKLHRRVIDMLEGVEGANWNRRTAQDHHCWTLVNLGKLDECRRLGRGYLERARERSDMQEVIEISSMVACALTFAGEYDDARKLLAEGRATWNPGRYLFGDVWATYPGVRLLLVERKPLEAVALTEQTLADMKRTFLDQHLLARHNVQELQYLACLHAGLAGHGEEYLRRARKGALGLHKHGNPVLSAHAAVIEAGVASVRGDGELARARWRAAADTFAENEMFGYQAAVETRLAEVTRGSESEASTERARTWFERERLVDPRGFVDLVAPARG